MPPNANVAIYNASLELVAYLENATGIAYKERKGEVWSASFCLPADDPKNAECQDFYYAEIFDGDKRVELFRIVLNGKSRIAGKPVIKYECKHVLSTLNDDTMVGVHNAGPGVTAALDYILGKQVVAHWQLGTVEFAQNFLHYWKDLSLLAALYTIPERFLTAHRWTFDTTSHPWTLNLLAAPTTVSARIAYQKNMQSVDRKSDVRNLYTRLYAYGYGAEAAQVDLLTIDLAAKGRPGFTSGSVEFTVDEVLTGALSSATAKVKTHYKVKGVWGSDTAEGVVFLTDVTGTFTDGENLNGSVSGNNCATLDSSLECVYAENVTKYGVITRKWEDQRYTVVENLYAAAEEKVDANATPELTYTAKAADLYLLTKRGQFVLGDLVKVYDGPLAIDVDARIVELSKKDVQGKPGDIGIQLGNKVEKFPDFGGIVYADDLDQVKDGIKWARVLSTQILAGEILLSVVPGSTIGAFPATPTVAGLYAGATHFGFHDGTNWKTFMDIDGNFYLGGTSGKLQWNAGTDTLTIVGAITATTGAIGGWTIGASTLTAGAGASAVGLAPGSYPFYAGNETPASASFRVSAAGAVVCTNLTISGGSINLGSGVFTVSAAGVVVASSISCTNLAVGAGSTWGGNTLAVAKIPSLDCDKITSGVFGTVRIPNLSCSKITSGTFDPVRIPNLSCDILTSGTLTGRTIRTAASGVRTQIDSSGGYSHYILQYDASKLRTSISGGMVTLVGTGTGEVTLYSSTVNRLNMLNLGGLIYASGGGLALTTIGGAITLTANANVVLNGSLIVMNDPVTIHTTTRDGVAYLTINGTFGVHEVKYTSATPLDEYFNFYFNGNLRKLRCYS